MNKKQILACPLINLGLTAQSRNALVGALKHFENPAFQFGYGATRRRKSDQLARDYTVQNAIDTINAIKKNWWESRRYSWCDIKQQHETFIMRLIELGLTQLDWIELPKDTVTLEMLKIVGKKRLLNRSILLLKGPSNVVIRKLEDVHNKPTSEVTIRDLLDTSRRTLDEVASNCEQSIGNTRKNLVLLGFKYEDGIFMKEKTRRYLAETLVKQEGISMKTARKIVEIAIKRHWMSGFVE